MSFHDSKWFNSLPTPKGDLEKIQRRGREYLDLIGMPKKSDEAWRFTDLSRLSSLFNLPFLLNNPTNKIRKNIPLPSSKFEGFQLVISPGFDPLESVDLPDGFTQLSTAELDGILGRTIDKCSCNDEWLVAVNNSCTYRVLGLRINGDNLPPLELVLDSREDAFVATRIVLIVESKTKFDLFQVLLGKNNSAHSHLLEMHIGSDACVNHGWLARGTKESGYFATLAIEQDIRSQYAFSSVQEGWSFGRLEQKIVQESGYASTALRGLQVSKGKEQIVNNSTIRFDGPEGVLDQLQKAIAVDYSHSIFNGSIEVPRIAQRTSASQLSRNLLLSKHARIDTKPQLKIVADDVKCTHGATVSQLQEEQVFYMLSRGISHEDAMRLLLKGYCEEIVRTLPVSGSRWGVLSNLLEGV